MNVSRELGFAQDWVENPEIFQDPFARFREKWRMNCFNLKGKHTKKNETKQHKKTLHVPEKVVASNDNPVGLQVSLCG